MTIKIVSIEGNIGAGKTTIFNKLEQDNQDPQIIFLREPVDLWEKYKDRNGETILSKFYNNKDLYAFPFQLMAFMTRIRLFKETIQANPNAKLIISERSLETDKQIFAKMLHDQGYIDDVMYKIYNDIFKTLVASNMQLSGIIYINTNPVMCLNRIIKRNREGELNISLDYLEKCQLKHSFWIHDLTVPTLNISSTYDESKQFMIYRFLQRILIKSFL